jgi:hypothetical protein
MGLSSYVKELAVGYTKTIARWADVPFDPSSYPNRGPKCRVLSQRRKVLPLANEVAIRVVADVRRGFVHPCF